jgi:hypothetical protein
MELTPLSTLTLTKCVYILALGKRDAGVHEG